MTQACDYVLFPGRHHLLTRFQAAYLRALGTGMLTALDGERIRLSPDPAYVWAVTSANHENTRRNPIPYDRRQAAIERLSATEGIRSLVVGVFDLQPSDRFAEITLKNVEVGTGGSVVLTPENCVVACSTPEVLALYRELGFRIAPVEHEHPDGPPLPWHVVEMLASGDGDWRRHAHPASVDVYERYGLDAHVAVVCNDPVIGDDGGLTTTRDYHTYVESFEKAAERKWAQASPHVKPGRIVDIGCATGGMLELASRDPRLAESDLVGVEVARHLYEECVHKKAQGAFANPNVYFYHRNVLGGAVFAERSVDTSLTFALTHEIWSYGSGERSLRAFAERIRRHTAPGGVWVNSDVCGPADPDQVVLATLAGDDGVDPPAPRHDLEDLSRDEVRAYVDGLSTRARFRQFAVDFARYTGREIAYELLDDGRVAAPLRDVMEYLETKDYTDSWLSECHESFCHLAFDDWLRLATDIGFEVLPVSHAWRNGWLVHHRFEPVARLERTTGERLDWPDTHALLVLRRPLDS